MVEKEMITKRKCKTSNCDNLIVYRNGIPTSKWCPSCTLKRNYKKSSLERAHKKTLKLPKIRTPRQRAIDRADEWFSRYIRLINGIVFIDTVVCECFTCGNFHNIKNIDCGHFINREHFAVRWEVNNARPQDTHCNCYRSGKHYQFEQRLIKEIGQSGIDDLKERAKRIADYSTEQIREIAKTYRISVRLKEKELGIKIF